MKRFFLYFLLFLFIAGLAVLAFGFYNAKRVRAWAGAAAETKTRYDIERNEKNIVGDLNALGGKKSEEFKSELQNFGSSLDSISSEMESAKKEIENLSAPIAARSVRSEMIDYYSQSGEQAKSLAGAVQFLNRVFETAIVLDRMMPDTTIEDIKGLIGEAKAKSGEIDPEILPAEMKNSGIDLKGSVDNYLEALDQYAAGKAENHDQLNSSYADFSQKEKDFWEARKNLTVLSNAQKISILGSKIDSDLMVLRKVKFSIK
ncbi:MAG: hypothetical protein NT093_01960 [Candidatus Moranbacteria bacterium]|nr:hypothetical protein [Candidatus Moranbacteria bacterium]